MEIQNSKPLHLKDKVYYSDLYDRGTIEHCFRMERSFFEGELPEYGGKKIPKENEPNLRKFMAEFSLYFLKGDCYSKKSETIRAWMDRDRARDDKLTNTPEPKYIRCLGCSQYMEVESKNLDTGIDSKNDRVLFFFNCNRCNKRRLFWENGEEWKYTPPPCPECRTALSHTDTREGNVVTTTYTCSGCSYTRADAMDLTVKPEQKEESIDPSFEANRQKYCLSDKEGAEYISWTENAKHIHELLKDREENKDTFDAIAKIKKLTLVEIQNLLNPPIEAAGYIKFEFGKPEATRDLSVEFSVQDNMPGRVEYDSIQKLKKLVSKTLEETNWRLIGNDVFYKLGFLTGRLRGVEGEEGLCKLVEKLEKKSINHESKSEK